MEDDNEEDYNSTNKKANQLNEFQIKVLLN